jgi:copper chaperone CopZ
VDAGDRARRAPPCTLAKAGLPPLAATQAVKSACASAVRAEISKLAGITDVNVDVDAGTVRISGEPLPGDASLREAVEEAGYEFAG